jgi:hypothetical protein
MEEGLVFMDLVMLLNHVCVACGQALI